MKPLLETKYTKDFLEPVVAKSRNLSEVGRFLNLKSNGNHLKRVIEHLGISTAHFSENRKYAKDVLEDLVAQSFSMAEVMRKLGLKPSGGNNSHIRGLVKSYKISTSHFQRAYNKGKTALNRKSPSEYLKIYSSDRALNVDTIKKRMFRDGVKERRCEICGITHWNGQETPIEIHHKDGNRWNNLLENLLIVCPNCHAQFNK